MTTPVRTSKRITEVPIWKFRKSRNATPGYKHAINIYIKWYFAKNKKAYYIFIDNHFTKVLWSMKNTKTHILRIPPIAWTRTPKTGKTTQNFNWWVIGSRVVTNISVNQTTDKQHTSLHQSLWNEDFIIVFRMKISICINESIITIHRLLSCRKHSL